MKNEHLVFDQLFCTISHDSKLQNIATIKTCFFLGRLSGHVFDRWTLECCSWESESQPSVDEMNSVPIQSNNNESEAVISVSYF